MRSTILTSMTLLLALATAVPATAVEEMPQGQATMAAETMKMPVRGMHMDQVEAAFGKPASVDAPVGDPPITRWHYSDYTVYFEYSYVIQSVSD